MNATATAPARQRKPRTKPQRFVRLMVSPAVDGTGVVRLTVAKKADDYFLTLLPADFGRGFKVEKIGLDCRESAYAVNIDADKRSCECKGFLRHGHCKHADGLAALIAAGKL
jgi:SWIM zinc finger